MWNQALSHRAYTWLGLGDRPAAARALLTGASAGALAGTAVALATAAPGETPAAVFAAGQSLYLAAATVLLVLGRERALLGALLPLTGALPPSAGTCRTRCAPPCSSPPSPRPSPSPRWSSGRACAGARPAGAGPALHLPPVRLLRPRQRTARPPRGRRRHPGRRSGAVIALTLSMGPAEWLLHRFRGESLTRLRTLSTAREFRRAVTGTLVLCLGGYLTVLLALALTAALARPGAPWPALPRLLALLLVGTVLWLGLLLQAFGAVLSAATVCLLAAAAQTVEPLAGPLATGERPPSSPP
ncbi:hypothetical protein O1L60_10490 [Streptomyces diastatochromogenes]|nr:hypothetical protein [Streptomyces diastatochromogenes]